MGFISWPILGAWSISRSLADPRRSSAFSSPPPGRSSAPGRGRRLFLVDLGRSPAILGVQFSTTWPIPGAWSISRSLADIREPGRSPEPGRGRRYLVDIRAPGRSPGAWPILGAWAISGSLVEGVGAWSISGSLGEGVGCSWSISGDPRRSALHHLVDLGRSPVPGRGAKVSLF